MTFLNAAKTMPASGSGTVQLEVLFRAAVGAVAADAEVAAAATARRRMAWSMGGMGVGRGGDVCVVEQWAETRETTA